MICRELSRKLAHLPEYYARSIEKIFAVSDIIALYLHDLRPSDVPFKHAFDLKCETSVYLSTRWLPSRHNELERAEIVSMIKSGIITTASSSWICLTVIATKKKEKPSFCDDYRVLNQKMKTERFPLTKIQDISDEIKGETISTALDLFCGFGQIGMEDSSIAKTTFVCRYGTFWLNYCRSGRWMLLQPFEGWWIN